MEPSPGKAKVPRRSSDGSEDIGHAPRVFISYSHDSSAHKERCLDLTQRLRGDGIDAWIDAFEIAVDSGWPLWCQENLQGADYVVVACTATYCDAFEGRTQDGKNLGVKWEGKLTLQMLYDDDARNLRFIPVTFDNESEIVPLALRGAPRYRLPSQHDYLRRHILSQPAARPTPVSSVRGLQSNKPDTDRELGILLEQRKQLVVRGESTVEIDKLILIRRRKLRDHQSIGEGTILASGRIELIEKLGDGGFATVWKGYDARSRTLVAVKLLHQQHTEDRSRRERFFRGARKMMELRHPGVVKVLEARVEEGGLAYFVMEYLSGGDLQRRVIEKTLPAMLKLKTVERIGEALQHAHKRGLIHRDVKPANILLTGDGTPKLTDFDLVHANDTTGGTRTGALGTWIYASPEAQHDASQVTAAADVFSLGMVAVFLLSGRSLSPDAFRDPSNYIDQLNCSPALRSVLKKATEWNQRRRYPTMELFLASFRAARAEHRRFLDSDGSPDIAAEFEHDSEWKRNRSVVALVFGFILSGLALIGYCSSKDLRGDEHAAQAMAVTGNATPEEETPAAAGRTATAQPDDVIVWSSPPHVEVYQNGSLVGNTPYTLNRPRSTIVKLELRLPGYEPRTVTVSEDYSSSSHFVLEKLNDKIEKPKTVPPSVDRPKPAVRNRDRSPGGIRSGSSGYTGRKPVPK